MQGPWNSVNITTVVVVITWEQKTHNCQKYLLSESFLNYTIFNTSIISRLAFTSMPFFKWHLIYLCWLNR